MKRTLCLLLALLTLTLGGCAGRIELALMAVCLGIDIDAEGVTLTVKSPDYSGSKKDEAGYAVLSVRGGTWQEAIEALYRQAPAAPQFGQLREILIGEAAFDHLPPRELLPLADQLPSVRSHALVTVCAGTAKAAVEAMEPQLGKRLSKYLDIAIQHYEEQGEIPATALSRAVREMIGYWRDPVVAYLGAEGYASALAFGSEGRDRLTAREVQLCRLIRGENQALRLSGCGFSLRSPARLSVAREEGRDILRLVLPVAIAYSLYEEAPPPGTEAALREAVEGLLRHLQQIGCDALGFGCQAVRGYSSLNAWLQSDWPRRYREAAVQVEIDAIPRQQQIN